MSEPGPEVMARFVGAENVDSGRSYLEHLDPGLAAYAGFPSAWNALATMRAALKDFDEGER